MKNLLILISVLFCSVGVFILGVGGYCIGTLRTETRLRNRFEAQILINKTNYDTMWKVIQQKTGIANEYKDAFAKIYPELIAGRYSGPSMMKWIQESNPNFDTSLYSNVMNTIEGLRTGFQREQVHLIDIHREHKNLVEQIPSSFVCTIFGRAPIPNSDIKLITSDKTEQAFDSGKENL